MALPVAELVDYPWPTQPGEVELPVWTGRGFRIGTRHVGVLSYEAAKSGWTDDLTTFHEETAGSDHPIDRASRELALAGLALTSADRPVVLEIGCSSGYMLLMARQRLPGAFWIGSDYVRAPLDKLAGVEPEIPLLHFDLRECPLPDSSVDA